MKRLTARRMEQLVHVLKAMYRAQDLDDLARTMPAAMTRVIPADIVTFSEVDLSQNRVRWHHHPLDFPLPKFRPHFERLAATDPLVRWYSSGHDGRAMKISDLATRSAFHAMPIYDEVYRRIDIEHQLAFVLEPAKPLIVGIALNRGGRDFTEDDRLAANLVRDHLLQAYGNAAAMTEIRQARRRLAEGVEQAGHGIVVLTPAHVIVDCTPKARGWLAAYFGWPGRGSTRRLPEALERWLGERCSSTPDAAVIHATPLAVEREGGTLFVRALVRDDHVLLVFQERLSPAASQAATRQALEAIGFSQRQAEVLGWVVRGKTNPEIAIILGVSARTIQTHLEHVYQKLNVPTRAAATARVMELMAEATPSRPRRRGRAR